MKRRDRRMWKERRKFDDPDYIGPERRKGLDRRSGKEQRSRINRRSGEERRQFQDPNYKGSERRKGKDRRSGEERRKYKIK